MKVAYHQALVTEAFQHELIKSDNFFRIAWKNFRLAFLEKVPRGKFPEAGGPVQPRAGYPVVPESRDSVAVGPTYFGNKFGKIAFERVICTER